jgi:hypothetical protein
MTSAGPGEEGTAVGVTTDDGAEEEVDGALSLGDPSSGESFAIVEGTSSAKRRAGGVFWADELAFMVQQTVKSRERRESISRRLLGDVGGTNSRSE